MEEVDVVGEVCPRPALIVRRRLDDLDPGDELVVTGDFPPAKENLQRTCEKHGCDVQVLNDTDERFRLQIRVLEDWPQ